MKVEQVFLRHIGSASMERDAFDRLTSMPAPSIEEIIFLDGIYLAADFVDSQERRLPVVLLICGYPE